MSRKFSFWERLSRVARHRLVVPIKRSPHPPEHTARAVMFGVFWALTPLVGVQMYLVFFTWLACRRSERLNFSLIIALAWTWISNVFTMWPLYYVFYVTGKLLLGRLETASGYQGFVEKWEAVLANAGGVIDSVLVSAKMIAQDQGIPLMVGCLPYAFGGAWVSYQWSLKYVRRRRLARRVATGRTKARNVR